MFPMAATRELNYTGYAVLRIKAGSNGKLVLARATKQEISSGAKKKKIITSTTVAIQLLGECAQPEDEYVPQIG